MATLVKCRYGDAELDVYCCIVDSVAVRCVVFDRNECPFGERVEGCGTCAHASAMTELDGSRMVDCELNELQMYSPYACECKHWERALG